MSTAVVNVVTGINRSGKTLYLLPMVEKLRVETGRPVYYWGIPGIEEKGKLPDWRIIEPFEDDWPRSRITDPNAVHDLPNGSIIVIDESHKDFGLLNGREVPQHIEQFSMSGHKGHTFFLCTQNAGDLHPFIRKRIGQHWHLVRAFGLERATVYNWQNYGDFNSTKSVALALKNEFSYPKEVYDWYRSSDNHAIAKKPPYKLFAQAGIAVVLLIACLIFVWTRISKAAHEKKEVATQEQVTAEAQPKQIQQLSVAQLKQDAAREWTERFEERVKGIPASAPIYDDSYKVAAMPRVSGCMNIVSPRYTRCDCNTQQGTRIETITYDQCIAYIKAGGWFDPTVPDGREESTRTASASPAAPTTGSPSVIDVMGSVSNSGGG